MPTLLLWDIDGTLLRSGGAGMRALEVALGTVFGLKGSLDTIDFAGRTDLWILRRVFENFGLPATEENFRKYLDGYFAALPKELAGPNAFVLPGIRTILAAAADRGLSQGLLTGNLRRGAEIKLNHHGIWSYFPFGAFADDSEFRDELGPHALRRAREHTGSEFHPDQVWVIGDTPHDISCGRKIGARTLAVATGGSTAEALAVHSPTAILRNFEDTDEFFRILGARNQEP